MLHALLMHDGGVMLQPREKITWSCALQSMLAIIRKQTSLCKPPGSSGRNLSFFGGNGAGALLGDNAVQRAECCLVLVNTCSVLIVNLLVRHLFALGVC